MKPTNKKNFKVTALKAEAREIVNKRGVRKNSIAFLNLYLPIFLASIILTLASAVIPSMITQTILLIIEFICYSAFTYSVARIINSGDGSLKFQFHRELFSVFIVITLAIQVILQFTLGSIFGNIFGLILCVLISIVSVPIVFLSALRNYPSFVAIPKGFILGNEYFWPILKMFISFIPLFILCIITFGILFIFKMTYITTSFGLLAREIFAKEGLM